MQKRLALAVLPLCAIVIILSSALKTPAPKPSKKAPVTHHYLYVATPGIRDYLGYGGHGLLVFDMDHNHRFVKRITTYGYHPNKKPSNVKGIAVSIPLNSVYISTIEAVQRIDLTTGKLIWEKAIEKGADRLAVSPDGMTMYVPAFEGNIWNVMDCKTGNIIKKIDGFTKTHNTVYGLSGEHVYMGDLKSPILKIANTKTNTIESTVGPFYSNIRPLTVNGKETRVYITTDSLLGFEVGDIQTGKKIAHIEVEGWTKGPVRRHGNPAHGIGLTPDEKEIWLCDGFNMRLHIFKANAPYQQLTSIPLQDMPGWITFSMDGKYAYPSSGEVIDIKTRRILTTLKDEYNNFVASEKMVEVVFNGNKAIKTGDQFGVGRMR